MRGWAIILWLALLPAHIWAQDSDKSLLETWLAEQLSTPERHVQIDGFKGALSSRAQMAKLTINDDQGPWLVAENLVLDWQRAALINGQLLINELSAQKLHLLRRPGQARSDPDAPITFSLPQIPIEIAINLLRIAQIEVDAQVFGQPLVGSLEGDVKWDETQRHLEIALTRNDSIKGVISVRVEQRGNDAPLTATLNAKEGKGGLIAKMIALPDAPALEAKGILQAQADIFEGNLDIAVNGKNELSAKISPAPAGVSGDYKIEIAGDLRPFFTENFHGLLGPSAKADALIAKTQSGGWAVPNLRLNLPMLNAEGQLEIDETARITALMLKADILGQPFQKFAPGAPQFSQAQLRIALLNANADWQMNVAIEKPTYQGMGYGTVEIALSAPRRLNGPAQINLQATGAAFGPLQRLLPAPQITGRLENALNWRSSALTVDLEDAQTVTRANISGALNDALNLEGVLSAGLFADKRPLGQLEWAALMQPKNGAYTLKATAKSQSGAAVQLDGIIGKNGDPSLNISGAAPLNIANNWIAPRRLRGALEFEGNLNSVWNISALTLLAKGRDIRLSDPSLGVLVDRASVDGKISDGVLSVDLMTAAKTLSASAFVDFVNGEQAAQSKLNAHPLQLMDYGNVVVDGELSWHANKGAPAALSGAIKLLKAELRLPENAGSFGPQPLLGVSHQSAPIKVTQSLARAGLIDTQAAVREIETPTQIDLLLEAPAKLFLRGRGIDAEFTGQLHLTGDLGAPDQEGVLSLERGRMDLLGQRLNLTQGDLRFSGRGQPIIDLRANASRDGAQITVSLQGALDQPEIAISSMPELPEEEALALLIFGTDLRRLSTVQAVQLFSAVRTLQGKSVGISERIRRIVGVDDFDVQTDEAGQASVKFGKYLNENLYTTVTVGAEGQSQIELNLDLNDNITAKTSIGIEGNQGVGLYFERDY